MTATDKTDNAHGNELLSSNELAARWKITTRTLRQWNERGDMGIPKPVRIGKNNLYKLSEILAYEASKQEI